MEWIKTCLSFWNDRNNVILFQLKLKNWNEFKTNAFSKYILNCKLCLFFSKIPELNLMHIFTENKDFYIFFWKCTLFRTLCIYLSIYLFPNIPSILIFEFIKPNHHLSIYPAINLLIYPMQILMKPAKLMSIWSQ